MDNATFNALERRVKAGEKLSLVDEFRYEQERKAREQWDDNPLLKQQHSTVNNWGQSADRRDSQ
jgi:hypothetical protein